MHKTQGTHTDETKHGRIKHIVDCLLRSIDKARESCDRVALLYAIRTQGENQHQARNLGGMVQY